MKPRKQQNDTLFLFQADFNQLLNPAHPLVKLANQIDWDNLETEFSGIWCDDNGAPAKAVRLMAGLQYLKYTFDESDESVVEKWIENPYWQYFCGYSTMQHKCPIHPTSMTKWRNKAGQEKLNLLLNQTVEIAVKQKYLPEKEMAKVNVDTTVQEKNITYPTDAKLLYKAILQLGKAAKKRGIVLRQSYKRVCKTSAVKAARYAHGRQFKRMNKQLKFMRTRVGRLIRDIRRKIRFKEVDKKEELEALLKLCDRVRKQEKSDSNKIYSLHEPEVQCISKGKARNKYEFGQKVSLVTTNRRDWFLASMLVEGNPHDSKTLDKTLKRVEDNTGIKLKEAYVDKGYRGNDYQGEAKVYIAGTSKRKLTNTQIKRRKRRSAIEPKIGHAKQENRLGRCYLKGLKGDAMNAILAAAGANMRKLLRLCPCAQILQQYLLIQRIIESIIGGKSLALALPRA